MDWQILLEKKFGTIPLPWSKLKTVQGTVAMFIGGWFFSILVLVIYSFAGALQSSLLNYFVPLSLITFVATVVESFPYSDIDNITVPVSAILLGLLILP